MEEIKTETDNDNITEYPHDDKPGVRKFWW